MSETAPYQSYQGNGQILTQQAFLLEYISVKTELSRSDYLKILSLTTTFDRLKQSLVLRYFIQARNNWYFHHPPKKTRSKNNVRHIYL